MKLIVGLGNPGEKYSRNRHNVGFMLVDFLVQKYPLKFEQNSKFKAALCEISTTEGKILFAKPETFMNRTGEAVKKLKNFYKVVPDSIVVAHDDLDIPFGKFKIQKRTGPKVHNGLSSIEQSLGTADFWRIRVGVDNRPAENRMPGEAYVLQDFNSEEQTELAAFFELIYIQAKLIKLFDNSV